MGFSLRDFIPGKGSIVDQGLRSLDKSFDLTGNQAAKAADAAAEEQVEGAVAAAQLLDPFQAIGQQGLDQANFLTDPQAQYDFLKSNPLFQASLDNANLQTTNMAVAQGRLGADDYAQNLANNTLLAASPLIADQKQSIGGLLDYGLTTAGNQGNLLTGAAAAEAGGIVGASNAQTQGSNNLLNLGATALASYFSDLTLKNNIKKTGVENGYNTYSWDWNEEAKKLGLEGSSYGCIAQEVYLITPEAVDTTGDYMKINYEMIGVKHGD